MEQLLQKSPESGIVTIEAFSKERIYMIINAIGGNGGECFYIQELATELGEKNIFFSFYGWNFEKDEQANFQSHQSVFQSHIESHKKVVVIFTKDNPDSMGFCKVKKWLIITIAVVTSIALIAAASVAIVFILSKQALEIEAKIQKRMVSINSEKFWTSEESNDVNFHCQIEVKNPHQSMRGNLTINHHNAT